MVYSCLLIYFERRVGMVYSWLLIFFERRVSNLAWCGWFVKLTWLELLSMYYI